MNPKLKPYHHISISSEMRQDLEVWYQFMLTPEAYSRPFMDCTEWTARDLDFYTDASRSWTKGGIGAVCQNSWLFQAWDADVEKLQPSIEYLELYAVTVAVVLGIHRFPNMRVYLFCDNSSIKDMINNSSSSCKNCMVLIRMITWQGLKHNVRIFCKHVRSKKMIEQMLFLG